jgi:hypothetical protein
VRALLSLFVLAILAGVLYRVWPSQAIDALRNDPNTVLRAPWQQAPPDDRPSREKKPRLAPAPATEPAPGALRVLFVGNSHTYYNDMPAMIAGLVQATPGARPFFFRMEAPAGARLLDHLAKGRVATALSEQRFDHVVLQEQQQLPSFSREQRQRDFEAPARTLDVMIRAAGARAWLYMPWARRDGDRDNRPDDTYEQMHARAREGYADLSRAIEAPTVPVGLVWKRVVGTHPDLPLWDADGYHATPAGSYLAACMFYKAFYERTPEGNTYYAGLPERDALRLQFAAGTSDAVLEPGE